MRGRTGPRTAKRAKYKVAYHTYLASGRRLSYTLSVEHVVDCKYAKHSLLVGKFLQLADYVVLT